MFHQDAHFSRRDFRSGELGGKIPGKSASRGGDKVLLSIFNAKLLSYKMIYGFFERSGEI